VLANCQQSFPTKLVGLQVRSYIEARRSSSTARSEKLHAKVGFAIQYSFVK